MTPRAGPSAETVRRPHADRLVVPCLSAALGLLIAVAAAMHIVAVVGVAYGERGGYDARLATLLWVGWTSLVCGALMVAVVPALRRRSTVALRISAGAAAAFLVAAVLVAPVSPDFWVAVPIFGGYLIVATTVHARWSTPDRRRPVRSGEQRGSASG